MATRIDLGLVKGPQGDKGEKGNTGAKGDTGAQGPAGADGKGVPTGGAANSVLIKNSATNYDSKWSAGNDFKTALGIPSISGGTALASGANLNNYRTLGTYHSATDAISTGLVNSPTKKAFVMVVNYANGTNQVIGQEVTEAENGKSYYRIYNVSGGTWTSWKRYNEDDDVIPVTKGGTGATTVEQALINLGITSAEQFLNANPKGSVLEFNYDASNDLLLIGGSWSKQSAGVVSVSAGTEFAVNSTGGANSFVMTEAQLAKHRHDVHINNSNVGTIDLGGRYPSYQMVSYGEGSNIDTNDSGSSEAISLMQKYKAYYRFERTA